MERVDKVSNRFSMWSMVIVFYYLQGLKTFQPKMFVNFCLVDHIPEDDFYPILNRPLI